jgi:pyruvate dehydrogenase E1 component alpha subunit
MPGVTVDGQDVRAVFAAATTAVERARAGGGPSFVECLTYRYYGHHQGDDPLRYRTAEEQTAARARDCLRGWRERLLADALADEPTLAAIDDETRRRIDEAVAFAEAGPLPEPHELLTDVYVPSAQRGDSETAR